MPGTGIGNTSAQAHFANVPQNQLPRSVFDRSNGLKTAFNSGDLIPIFLDEVLPGDTFNMQATCFGRFATMSKPIMDNVYLDVQFWFVPMRLLWDNFLKFMGEVEPGDTTEYLIPTLDAPNNGFNEETLADYLGIPPGEELDDSTLYPSAPINASGTTGTGTKTFRTPKQLRRTTAPIHQATTPSSSAANGTTTSLRASPGPSEGVRKYLSLSASQRPSSERSMWTAKGQATNQRSSSPILAGTNLESCSRNQSPMTTHSNSTQPGTPITRPRRTGITRTSRWTSQQASPISPALLPQQSMRCAKPSPFNSSSKEKHAAAAATSK